MYSNNDWRDYSNSLEHGRWEWPGGKNSKEYNHNYYQHNKDKWKRYAKNALDKVIDVGRDIGDKLGVDELEEYSNAQQEYYDNDILAKSAARDSKNYYKLYKSNKDFIDKAGARNKSNRIVDSWKDEEKKWLNLSKTKISESAQYRAKGQESLKKIRAAEQNFFKTPIGKFYKRQQDKYERKMKDFERNQARYEEWFEKMENKYKFLK